MKKIIGALLIAVVLLASIVSYATEVEALSSDPQYQVVYSYALQVAETAGFENYGIIVSDDYNVTINVFDEAKNIKESIDLGKLHFAHDPNEVDPVEALNISIADKESQIETLIANAADKDEQIDLLVTSAALKDAKIEILENDITEQNTKILALETDVIDKASTIETLQTDSIVKANGIVTLENDVKEKGEKIKALEANAVEKEAKSESMEADVSEKEILIKSLEKEVAEGKTAIENLEADAKEKTTRIESLEADVTDKTDKITALVSEVTEKVKENENLKTAISEKDTEIETLSTTVVEKTAQIETLNADVSDKKLQIETLTSKNNSQAAQLLMFKEMIVDAGAETSSQKINNLSVIVPTKDYVIERLSTISDIAKIAAVTVDNDPNGQLGKKGQYIEQIYFSSPLVNPEYAGNLDLDVIDAGTACGGSVEVYRTIADAEERDRHLAYYDGTDSSSGSHKAIGTLVIRTSSSLPLVDQKKLEEEIINALISE